MLLCVCLALNARENSSEIIGEIIDTPNGFEVHADVPSGLTSTTTIIRNKAQAAHFAFEITQLRGNKDWPAGVNFSFFSKNKKNSFHTGFLTDTNVSENVIMTIKIVEDEKLIGSDYFPIEAKSLDDVAVGFRWDNKKISMQYNGNPLAELVTLAYDIETLTFGLQSSTGKISVELPNKPVKADAKQ